MIFKNKKVIITLFIVTLCMCIGYCFYIDYKNNNTINDSNNLEDFISIEQIDNIDDVLRNRKNLDDFKVDIEANENLKVEEIEKGSNLDKLIQLQKKVEKAQNEKDKMEDDLFILNNEIATYKTEMRKNEQIKQQKQNSLLWCLKWLGISHNSLDFYLSAFNSNDFRQFLFKYNLITEFVDKTSSNIIALEMSNHELDLNRNEIANKKALYKILITSISEKEKDLMEQHNDLLAVVNNEALEAEAYNSLRNLNSRINNRKYFYRGNSNGFMILPVTNYEITSEWGDRIHPISGDVRHHAGVDLGVDINSVVRASADGIVIMASWYGGYGKAVMIDHGNNLVTLYGHNNQLLVSEGDTVVQGQPIALAGSTGYSTGSHCHFEVRQNDVDINPFTYIRN